MIRINKIHPVLGYLPGFRQSAVVAELVAAYRELPEKTLNEIDSAFAGLLPAYRSCSQALAQGAALSVFDVLQEALTALLEDIGFPVFSPAKILRRGHSTEFSVVSIAIPSIGQDYPIQHAVLTWVIDRVNALTDPTVGRSALALGELKESIRKDLPQGMNTIGFLRAANDQDIPWQRVMLNVYQFGWGSKARWLDSSFTDKTPTIAGSLARNKFATAQILRRAGIPVPDHYIVRDEHEAVALASKLGYPVVVKPLNMDGGVGVFAGLKNEDSVRKAYAAARSFSAAILVEKHFEGNDYRLQVYEGQVYWAVHRVPGGLTGDGERNVRQLLEALNADPERGDANAKHLLKRIPMDEEALDLLAEQDLSPDGVPAQGRFVRLRRAANVASGGVPLPVLEQAHPDNLALAVRAARLLRLDIAGIDLLIPDIRQSWLETGAAICEVNAQPQMSPTLPSWLLSQLVEEKGRIPVVAILGEKFEEASWFTDLLSRLSGAEKAIGVVSAQGVRLGGTLLSGASGSFGQSMRVLLSDPAVEGVLAVIAGNLRLGEDLPIDRFDYLVVVESPDRTDIQGRALKHLASVSTRVDLLASNGFSERGRLGAAVKDAVSPESVCSKIISYLKV